MGLYWPCVRAPACLLLTPYNPRLLGVLGVRERFSSEHYAGALRDMASAAAAVASRSGGVGDADLERALQLADCLAEAQQVQGEAGWWSVSQTRARQAVLVTYLCSRSEAFAAWQDKSSKTRVFLCWQGSPSCLAACLQKPLYQKLLTAPPSLCLSRPPSWFACVPA